MKVSSFFDLITDGKDLVEFFEGVDTPDQLISRLEHLKHRDTDDLLASIDSLRTSITGALTDTLEMSSTVEDEDLESDPDLDALLDDQPDQPDAEDQISPKTPSAPK